MWILRLVRNFALLAVLALAAHAAAAADKHGRCFGSCDPAKPICPNVCGRCVMLDPHGHGTCVP